MTTRLSPCSPTPTQDRPSVPGLQVRQLWEVGEVALGHRELRCQSLASWETQLVGEAKTSPHPPHCPFPGSTGLPTAPDARLWLGKTFAFLVYKVGESRKREAWTARTCRLTPSEPSSWLHPSRSPSLVLQFTDFCFSHLQGYIPFLPPGSHSLGHSGVSGHQHVPPHC